MPPPIEATLSTLLPTITFLPPDLISLATSLLAQSRTKAASLKAEEEIARTYACCHIACQRLGNKLALEVAKPTPPPRTPKGKRTEDKLQAGQTSAKRGEVAHVTPVKTAAVATTSITTRKRTASARQDGEAQPDVPDFTMPMIRNLCKELDTPEAAPHIFVGISTIWNEQHESTSADEQPAAKKRRVSTKTSTHTRVTAETIPALVITIWTAVTNKLYPGDEDPHATPGPAPGVEAFQEMRIYLVENDIPLPKTMAEEWESFEAEARDHWLKMEWYESVPDRRAEGGAAEEEDDDEDLMPIKRPAKTPLHRKEKHGKRSLNADDDDDDDDEYYVGAAGLRPGLGTMFQPTVDWLSDKRRVEYAQWKKGILQEAALIEQRAR